MQFFTWIPLNIGCLWSWGLSVSLILYACNVALTQPCRMRWVFGVFATAMPCNLTPKDGWCEDMWGKSPCLGLRVSSILLVEACKTRSFPIKTRVIKGFQAHNFRCEFLGFFGKETLMSFTSPAWVVHLPTPPSSFLFGNMFFRDTLLLEMEFWGVTKSDIQRPYGIEVFRCVVFVVFFGWIVFDVFSKLGIWRSGIN